MSQLARFRNITSAVVARASFGVRYASYDGHVKDMGGSFKDRESAFENAYFNKEEHLKMEALIKKLRRQIEPTAAEQSADKQALTEVLAKHKLVVNDQIVADLMKWRFGK